MTTRPETDKWYDAMEKGVDRFMAAATIVLWYVVIMGMCFLTAVQIGKLLF